jgi:hypothetical protein
VKIMTTVGLFYLFCLASCGQSATDQDLICRLNADFIRRTTAPNGIVLDYYQLDLKPCLFLQSQGTTFRVDLISNIHGIDTYTVIDNLNMPIAFNLRPAPLQGPSLISATVAPDTYTRIEVK